MLSPCFLSNYARCTLLLFFVISSSVQACQHALCAQQHVLSHFSSCLPDPWTPADPLPPACVRPWRMEVEPLLAVKRPFSLIRRALASSGVPAGHCAGTLQGSLTPVLGTQALVVMRVPSSHCDAITAVAREPPRENLLEGALPRNLGTLTAALGTLVPPAGWWHRVSCTTSGAAAPPLILTFAPSGQAVAFGQTDQRPAHPLASQSAVHWIVDRGASRGARASANQP